MQVMVVRLMRISMQRSYVLMLQVRARGKVQHAHLHMSMNSRRALQSLQERVSVIC